MIITLHDDIVTLKIKIKIIIRDNDGTITNRDCQ